MSSCSCYNYKNHHVVKAGFLRRFKKGFLSKGFKVVYAEISKDGYLLWYRNQYSHRIDGAVDLKEVCDFLAVGPYTKSIPSRIILPKSVPERNLVAVPASASRHAPVHWFLCANDLDLNQWIMVMNYVLLTQKNVAMPFLDPKSKDEVAKDGNNSSTPSQDSSIDKNFSLYETIKSSSTYSSLSSTPKNSNSEEEKSKKAQSSRTLLTTTHNGSLVPIPPPPTTKTNHLSQWGWLWGCGMGWGVEGWHAYEFLPSVGSELKMEDLKEALETGVNGHMNHNPQCDLSEQTFDDYDCAEFESGFNDVGFDTSLDAGGIFDAGFSLGF